MPRFFVPPSQIYDDEIVILGDDARHIISSLRMREGEEITVCDMNRRDYFCRISTAFDGLVRDDTGRGTLENGISDEDKAFSIRSQGR